MVSSESDEGKDANLNFVVVPMARIRNLGGKGGQGNRHLHFAYHF